MHIINYVKRNLLIYIEDGLKQDTNSRFDFPFFFCNFFHASADRFVLSTKLSISSMQWFKIC